MQLILFDTRVFVSLIWLRDFVSASVGKGRMLMCILCPFCSSVFLFVSQFALKWASFCVLGDCFIAHRHPKYLPQVPYKHFSNFLFCLVCGFYLIQVFRGLCDVDERSACSSPKVRVSPLFTTTRCSSTAYCSMSLLLASVKGDLQVADLEVKSSAKISKWIEIHANCDANKLKLTMCGASKHRSGWNYQCSCEGSY